LKIGEEVNFYCFHLQGYLPFLSLKTNESIIFFINNNYLKKIKIKK